MSSVQRFGPCDPEEKQYELYTDIVQIEGETLTSRAIYNLTLIATIEYSCIIFKAEEFQPTFGTTKIDVSNKNKDGTQKEHPIMTNPQIYLRRWCSGPPALCYGFQYLETHFYVEIIFSLSTKFSVKAYGRTAKIIDPAAVMGYRNKFFGVNPSIPSYLQVLHKLIRTKGERKHFWFYNEDYGIRKSTPRPVPGEPPIVKETPTFIFSGTPPRDESATNKTGFLRNDEESPQIIVVSDRLGQVSERENLKSPVTIGRLNRKKIQYPVTTKGTITTTTKKEKLQKKDKFQIIDLSNAKNIEPNRRQYKKKTPGDRTWRNGMEKTLDIFDDRDDYNNYEYF